MEKEIKNIKTSDEFSGHQNMTAGEKLLDKVPQVTIFFWVIKIMATTVGETGADFLNFNLNFGLTATSLLMSVLLVIVLYFQFRSKKYTPNIYWLAVVMISIVGTLITDNLVDNFGVPLIVTTIAFAFALTVTFVIWYASEKTLSIHTIYTRKRECFYWFAILFTFALGTAAGDLFSEQLALGYLTSAIIFASMIGIVAIAFYRLKLGSVTAFWIAYILTRPLGASLGDFLSQSHRHGGLALGTVGTSAIFLITILSIVTFLNVTKKDQCPAEKKAI
jgi:uncharacterized membrane-anchored protein